MPPYLRIVHQIIMRTRILLILLITKSGSRYISKGKSNTDLYPTSKGKEKNVINQEDRLKKKTTKQGLLVFIQ